MPDKSAALSIRYGLEIPRREVWFEFSHASGPGGQNVNKVATAVALCFHPDSSGALSPEQKARVKGVLGGRINADGVLRVTAAAARSQAVNRMLVEQRFRELLAEALKPAKKRRPTRPSRASKEKRLADKRFRSVRKSERNADMES